MNDVQIANWLNDNGHKTPIGNIFENNPDHSIAKKRKSVEIQKLHEEVLKPSKIAKELGIGVTSVYRYIG